MSRKREQAELIFKLGQLFGPLLHVLAHWDQYDTEDRERVRARFFADDDGFIDACRRYAHGEPGHVYEAQATGIRLLIHHFRNDLRSTSYGTQFPHLLRKTIEATVEDITQHILSIPVAIDSAIHEAHTPYSTYGFVKDLCTTVRTQVVWLDRYVDHTIFHRYFADTPRTAQITLVTWPASKFTNNSQRQRYNEFLDISKLFASERGPNGYRLLTLVDFHDRWLRADDKLFALGGSIKDLGKPFTISRLDSKPENAKHFDDAVANGTELFGPNQTAHL